MIHRVKSFNVVSEAGVDIFLEFPAFSMIQQMYSFCFYSQIQKNIAKADVNDILPVFSSRILMGFGVAFKFLIEFEFIFV